MNDFTLGVGQPHSAAAVLICELRVVNAEQVKYGRLQIMDMDPILAALVSKIVRGAVGHTPFDSGAGQPNREPVL